MTHYMSVGSLPYSLTHPASTSSLVPRTRLSAIGDLCNFLYLWHCILKKCFHHFFPLPVSEPRFMRLIVYISTDYCVLRCFDTVGSAVYPVKVFPEMT